MLSLLTNCSSIPDVPILTRLNATSGYYVYTISNKEGVVDDTRLLDGKTWTDLVIESVLIPVDSWKEIKKYIITNCKRNAKCSDNIDSWDRKLNSIDKNL